MGCKHSVLLEAEEVLEDHCFDLMNFLHENTQEIELHVKLTAFPDQVHATNEIDVKVRLTNFTFYSCKYNHVNIFQLAFTTECK